MAQKRIPPTDQAQALLDWLTTLQLPSRVITPLRRDLEAVLSQDAGAPGKGGILVGLDHARFIDELYRDEGGQIRRIPSVGALVIETLREVIPPPDRKRRPRVADDFVLPDLEDDEAPATTLAELVAPPAPTPTAHASPPALIEPTPTSILEPATESRVSRTRSRLRRGAAAIAGAAEPAAETAPSLAAIQPSVAPAAAERLSPAHPQDVPADTLISESVITAALAVPADDPLYAQIRQLWADLHPQGRRAVLAYAATLLVIEP